MAKKKLTVEDVLISVAEQQPDLDLSAGSLDLARVLKAACGNLAAAALMNSQSAGRLAVIIDMETTNIHSEYMRTRDISADALAHRVGYLGTLARAVNEVSYVGLQLAKISADRKNGTDDPETESAAAAFARLIGALPK